jgi:tetratricopeptide (TPR) repeat protein
MLSAQADTPFSRYLPIEEPWGGPVRERPIRVLVVISAPSDEPSIDVAPERESLEAAFAAAPAGELEAVFLRAPATLEGLEEALWRGDFHVVHYLGHGAFDDQLEQAVLFFEDEDRCSRTVRDDEFCSMLARQGIQPRLVFLAACESATRSTTDAFAGLGPKLVSAGVPAVVAMQEQVLIETARKFSKVFYARLVEHGSVDRAANGARSTLLTAGQPDAAVPVLFMRLRSGQLWGGEPEEEREPVYTPPPPPDPDELPEPGSLPPGSRLAFQRNALFTGREEPLKALARTLLHDGATSTLVTQAVQGMGGMGKTQLAVEFAHRYGRFFHGVHWLNCAQPDLIAAEVAACGERMRLSRWPKELPEQVEAVLRAWHEGGPRLVVLDNLEDMDAACEWLQRLGEGGKARLLLTARRGDWPRYLGLEPLRLKVFARREAHDFLRRYLPQKRASDAELRDLAERLGRLPLALELAGRYLERRYLPVADYLEKLGEAMEHRSMRGWQHKMGSPTGHDLDLMATFAVSWEQVEDEVARRLFLLAACCAPNQPIPCALLEEAADLEEEACGDALVLLTGLGLLEMEDPAAGPAIHPLLAEYGRALPQEPALSGVEGGFAPLPALAGALARLCYEANESGLPARFAPLRPHLEVVTPSAEGAGLGEAVALFVNLGFHLSKVADYAGARAAYERALAIAEAVYGPDHPTVATVVNNLGLVLQDLGDLAGAQAAFERALAIDEAVYGPDHPEVATDVNNLGRVLQALGDLAGARAAYERALAIWQETYGEEHPQVATGHNNLGAVLKDLGDLAGARAAYERALAIDQRTYGSHHPAVARDVNNLGLVLRDLGDLAGARAALERVLEILAETLPAQHPYVASTVNNLGAVLRAQGDRAGARAAYERALTIAEAVYGPDHPEVATVVNNLGLVLQDLGDRAGARAAYERALAIAEAVYGPEHPTVAIRVNNLAGVLRDLGDLDGARAAYEGALAILERFLPPNHPHIALVRRNLESLPE